jgi:hypothetical protein
MGLAATTQQLVTEIIGKDLLTPAAASAEKSIVSLSSSANLASNSTSAVERGLGAVGTAATTMGNALNHAKGFVSNLVSGPLGFIGLGAAAFSVAGALKSGIDTANTLAAALEKLTAITGDSAESLSALLAVADKYGISSDQIITSAAFAEKTIGKLADTMSGKGKDAVSKLTQLQKQYGISLEDSSGKAVDFETELNRVADYYTSNATASQKAALAATLFGRGYQALIPLLQLGSKGLADAEAAATSLGLTLTAQNVGELKDYQANMRDASEAVAGLKLTLALSLIPTLTDLAKHFTAFVTDHRTDIKAFFLGAVSAAKTIGSALLSVGQFAKSAWDAIPGPLQTLMIQALIGNKVIKTVFGIDIVGSIAGAVGDIGKKLLGSIGGSLFSRGSTAANPLYVADVTKGFGGLGGGGPASEVEEAAGGGGLAEGVGAAFAGISPAAIAAAGFAILGADAYLTQNNRGPSGTGQNTYGGSSVGGDRQTRNPDLIAIQKQSQADTSITTAAIKQLGATTETALGKAADDIAEPIEILKGETQVALSKLVGATTSQTAKVTGNQNLLNTLVRSNGKLTYDELIKLAHQNHLDHLNSLTIENKQFAKAADILKSNETTKQKIIDLNAIQSLFSKRGDTASAAKIASDITGLQGHLVPPLDSIAAKIGAIQGAQETASQNRNAAHTSVTVTSKSVTSANQKTKRVGPTRQNV